MSAPPTFPERTTWETIRLGLKGRCPRCGAGRVFSRYLKVADKCDACGLGLHGHDTGDGPVVPALLVLGAVIVGLAMYVEFTFEPAVWVHMVLWTPVVVLSTLGILPLLKGLSIALQHKFRSTEETEKLGGQ